MTIDQLLYFSEVYRQRSINAASWNLHISQQCLSASIRQLEKEFSAVFFIRSRKGVTPTAAGERFYRSAQVMINEFFVLRHDLDDTKSITQCRVGLMRSMMREVYSKVFLELSKTFPEVFFDIFSVTQSELQFIPVEDFPDMLFTIVYEKRDDISDKFVTPEGYKMCYISAAPKAAALWTSTALPLAGYNMLTPKYLRNIAGCFPKNQSDLDTIDSYFERAGVTLKACYLAETQEIFVDVLKNGRGVSIDFLINNRPLLHPELLNEKDLVLKPLSDDFAMAHFVLLYKNNCEIFYPIIADILNQQYY